MLVLSEAVLVIVIETGRKKYSVTSTSTSGADREKGVRHQKCKAPEGPFRLLVSDPFFST
jgi:hypothetical protein